MRSPTSLLQLRGLACAAVFLARVLPVSAEPAESEAGVTTIERDVAIVGGGAAGSYSAIVLKEDHKRSVVVIEKDSLLGGHVTSWTDPSSNLTYECGVQNYLNITGAQRHFDRLGIPVELNVRTNFRQRYVDFTTGVEVSGYIPPDNADRIAAMNQYITLINTWRDRLEPSWLNFFPAAEIPKDLLLPFKDFLIKHNLTAAMPGFFAATGFGAHNVLDKPAVSVIRSLGPDMVNALLGKQATIVPVSHRNQDIYEASERLIGRENILYSSTVFAASLPCQGGNGDRVTLMVRNSKTGWVTKVVAKKLLWATSPTEENLAPFPLEPQFRRLFTKLTYSNAYVAVISHPALPNDTTIVNTPSGAAPRNYLSTIPAPPFHTRFEPYVNSTYFRAVATGDDSFTPTQAKAAIQDALDKMLATGVLKGPAGPIVYHEFQPHVPMGGYPSARHMKCGYYDRLNAGSGRCGTFYASAAFGMGLSTNLWLHCEKVVGKLVESLG